MDKASMHWYATERTRSFNMGLISAKGQKLDYFKWEANNNLKSTLKSSKKNTLSTITIVF